MYLKALPSRYQVQSFIHYFLEATNQHGIHSPYFFKLYQDVFRGAKSKAQSLSPIETLRDALINRSDSIDVKDLGAGSKKQKTNYRKVSTIAKHGISQRKYALLHHRLVAQANFEHVVELGTSFGIHTLYLAKATKGQVTTFEGCDATAQIAEQSFSALGQKNIQLIRGNIDEQLPIYLSNSPEIGFAYFDANHRLAPTLSYFEACLAKAQPHSIFVFDDIHWSKEMGEAWKQIKAHPAVTSTIDIYQSGWAFFNPSFTKNHYTLMY